MKNIQLLFSAAVCGLVLTITTATADNSMPGVATVVRVKGVASYTLGGGDTWHPLLAGKLLAAGATIKTESDTFVDVVLGKRVAMPQARPTPDQISLAPDSPVRGLIGYTPAVQQNVVRLSGNTTLKIDTLTVSETGVDTISDTELDLKDGCVFYSVRKLSSESKFLFKFANGIAGIRGSAGILAATPSPSTSPATDVPLTSIGAFVHSVDAAVVDSAGKTLEYHVPQGNILDLATGQMRNFSPQQSDTLDAVTDLANSSFYEITRFANDPNAINNALRSGKVGFFFPSS